MGGVDGPPFLFCIMILKQIKVKGPAIARHGALPYATDPG